MYVSNLDSNTIAIYDLTNRLNPTFIRQFNNGNLSSPEGLAILGNILYVSNFTRHNIVMYDITYPHEPRLLGDFNRAHLFSPDGLLIY